MLGPLFSVIEVACERLNRMLGAAKICVCSVLYIAVEIESASRDTFLGLRPLSNIQNDFEAAVIDFNTRGQPQFAAHSSMPASGVASARRCQNERSG